jgi:hypothetical protein
VLNALERLGPYVVPGDDPQQPRHDLKRPWDALTRRAGLSGVRLHDLRHTYASFGAGGGLGLPIIGRLLATPRRPPLRATPISIAIRCGGPLKLSRGVSQRPWMACQKWCPLFSAHRPRRPFKIADPLNEALRFRPKANRTQLLSSSCGSNLSSRSFHCS